jgi:hypothetical protein
LIKELLDDSTYNAALLRGAYGERAFITEMLPRFGFVPANTLGYQLRQPVTPAFGRGEWIFRPVWQIDLCTTLDLATANCDDAREHAYGEPSKPNPLPPTMGTFLERSESTLTNILAASFVGTFDRRTAELSIRRLAAAAIAIRVYEIDRGSRPESLQELVPGYLPRVPTDPMVKGNLPILYAPDESPPFVATRASVPSTTKLFRLATPEPSASAPASSSSSKGAHQQNDIED